MKEPVASIDFETRSTVDIKLGLDHYTSCPEFEVLVLSGRLPGLDVGHWHRGHDCAQPVTGADWLAALHEYVRRGGKVRGWNIMFEWMVWNKVAVPKYGWPELPIEQCVDTMAQAAAHNLPQALDKCGEALGLDPEKLKSKRGKYLIQRLCVPHKPTKDRPGVWVQDPELFAELVQYCDQDVIAEESIAKKLRPLTEWQQRVWLLTQRINRAGVPVHLGECEAIESVVEAEKQRLNGELARITRGAVPAASNRDKLLAWVNANIAPQAAPVDFVDPVDEDDGRPGHGDDELDDLRGKTVEDALKRDDLPPAVRRALEIRAAVVQTSTAKFTKMRKVAVRHDGWGFIRGMFTYHGAGTGRWASRGGVNVQNFTRPSLVQDLKTGIDEIEAAHQVLGRGDHAGALALWGDSTMDAAVSCLRGVIHAPPGHEFIDADFSSVENRVGVWLAGQEDKVELFRKGLDEYKVFASKALYRVPYDAVTKDMRQMSKSAVLGCFAADTKVLTCRGFVPIVEVRNNDRIWDGVDFVTHGGVVFQGVKPVIDFAGVRVTPDHKILGEEGWERADSIDLRSAIRTAGGPSSGTSSTVKKQRHGFGVRAALSGLFRSTTCVVGRLLGAGGALTATRTTFSGRAPAAQTLFPTSSFASAGSIGASQQSPGATERTTQSTQTTAAEGSVCAASGVTRLRLFFAGLLRSPDGRTPLSNSTGSITTGPIPRITVGSRLVLSRTETSGRRGLCLGTGSSSAGLSSGRSIARAIARRARSFVSCVKGAILRRSSPRRTVAEEPTYDILNCGPRSRFVVLTEAGPVIAHNCLFGQGWRGLITYALQYDVVLEPEHSQEIVKSYRREYEKVRNLWYACGDASIDAVRNPSTWFSAGDKLELICHKNFLWMKLPSGRYLAWSRPKIETREAPWMEKFFVGYDEETGEEMYEDRQAMRDVVTVESIETRTRKYVRHPLIGSSIFQSAVQGTAADILAEGTLEVEAAGYTPVLLAHDECLSIVPEGWGDEDEYGRLLCTAAPWREDLPLAYEAYRAKRFRK